MKHFVFVLTMTSVLFLVASCNQDSAPTEVQKYACPMECEGEKTYSAAGSCPVCKMDLELVESDSTSAESSAISETSIFNLTSKWNTQDSKTIELKDLRGEVLVVVMVYTTCKAACPRLVVDMKSIHSKVNNNDVRFVMVSIDPETDTPAKLKAFAKSNALVGEQWILMQGTVDDVREFSNVLAVKYKQISPMDFSHSNIISVFNPAGELVYQQEGLGVDNKMLVGHVKELVTEGEHSHHQNDSKH